MGYYDCYFIIEASFFALIKIHKLGVEYSSDEIDNLMSRNFINIDRISFQNFLTFFDTCLEISIFLSNLEISPLNKEEKNLFKVNKNIFNKFYY